MWIVFRKSDRLVIGASAHARQDVKKAVAVRQAVKGHVEGGKLADFDAVRITDEAEVLALLGAEPGQEIVIEEDGGRLRPAVREPETYALLVETDVEERHPLDGVPVLPADGTSAATITVRKAERGGRPLRRAADNDELWLRADYGTVEDAAGQAIRRVRLKKGEASFRLRSETALRVATVQILSADPNLDNAAVRIEFG